LDAGRQHSLEAAIAVEPAGRAREGPALGGVEAPVVEVPGRMGARLDGRPGGRALGGRRQGHLMGM